MILQLVLAIVAAFGQVDAQGGWPQSNSIQPVDLYSECVGPDNAEIGEAKTKVLLVHGYVSTLRDWDTVNKEIAQRTGRTVCTIDLRNRGMSPWNERNDEAAMTADIHNFVQKMNPPKVNIIGTSIGAKYCVDYTLKHPDNVNSLVVEDMRPNGVVKRVLDLFQFEVGLLKEAIQQVPFGFTEEIAQNIIYFHNKLRLLQAGFDPILIEQIAQKKFPIKCDGTCRYLFNVDVLIRSVTDPAYFLTDSYGIYRGPALFIYGTASPLDIPSDEANIKILFPYATLYGVAGAGHKIHGNRTEYVDMVSAMLNALPN